MRADSAGSTNEHARRAALADRYGTTRTRTPRRWRRWLFVAAAIVFSVVIAYLAYRNLGSAPIEAERAAFDEKPGNAMAVTIDVTRNDPARAGVCVVRVRDLEGTETGRKELLVPPGESSVRKTTVVRSSAKPVTAEVFGCSYDVPNYLSSSKRPTE